MKKLLIIQSAEEIFQNKPYDHITMDEIAKKSGMTKKTVYSYFPSKVALFINIFESYLQQLHEKIFLVISQDLPIQTAIRNLFLTLFEFTQKNEKIFRLFWALESEDVGGILPIELTSRMNIWNKAMLDAITDIVRKGIKDGEIRSLDPELIVHLLSAVNKGIFIHTNKEKRFNIANISAQKLFDTFCDIIFDQIVEPSISADLQAK